MRCTVAGVFIGALILTGCEVGEPVNPYVADHEMGQGWVDSLAQGNYFFHADKSRDEARADLRQCLSDAEMATASIMRSSTRQMRVYSLVVGCMEARGYANMDAHDLPRESQGERLGQYGVAGLWPVDP